LNAAEKKIYMREYRRRMRQTPEGRAPCNTALGFFRDNTQRISNALLYLKRSRDA